MTPSKRKIHPALEPFMQPGGFFDVEPSALDLDIDKFAVYINPVPAVCWQPHRIEAVQKIYDGSLAYRGSGVFETLNIGRPFKPDEVTVHETEAEAWDKMRAIMEARVTHTATYVDIKGFKVKLVPIIIDGVVNTGEQWWWSVRSKSQTRVVRSDKVSFVEA